MKFLLKILVSVSLVLYLLYKERNELSVIKENLLSFGPIFFVLAIICLIIGTFFSALRWKVILKGAGYDVKVVDLFRLYIKGYFYNNFLPTQMGGDVYKSVSLGNKIGNQGAALFSVFMDRFSGLIVLLAIGIFGISYKFGFFVALLSIAIFGIGIIAYPVILKAMAVKIKFLEKFEKANKTFLQDKKSTVKIIFLSILVQVSSFLMASILFFGMGIVLSFWTIFAFMPLASLSLLIPSFNGYGTQDTVYAFLFGNAGVTVEISIAVSLLIHLIRIVMSLIGGLIILSENFKK